MMQNSSPRRIVLILLLMLGSSLVQAASPTKGDKAPSFAAHQWINQKQALSEDHFKGRLVLLERWATWCGPCVANIPHLNDLADQFGKSGLIVVGISQEAPQVIKNFAAKKGVKYLLGSGGADAYDPEGIPHAWLISPRGRVVWEGHPADLEEQTIRNHLKDVTVAPEFRLPEKLKAAEKLLNQRQYGQGLKLLQVAAVEKTPVGSAAQDAIKKVTLYGQQRLKGAVELAAKKDFCAALVIVTELVNTFEGSEIADAAKARQNQWECSNKQAS